VSCGMDKARAYITLFSRPGNGALLGTTLDGLEGRDGACEEVAGARREVPELARVAATHPPTRSQRRQAGAEGAVGAPGDVRASQRRGDARARAPAPGARRRPELDRVRGHGLVDARRAAQL